MFVHSNKNVSRRKTYKSSVKKRDISREYQKKKNVSKKCTFVFILEKTINRIKNLSEKGGKKKINKCENK